MTITEPITLPQQFIRFTWLSAGACPVFVAATEREIRVRTLRQAVLINANFWPRVQCPRPYCASITSGSVPFRSVPGFIASRKFQTRSRSTVASQQLLCLAAHVQLSSVGSAAYFV